ncbi:MAG: Orotate phosphoribosyltransferase [Methanosaeta sp. PtaB.Bin039]|nr:MAG: Orotate phosphoribosyltransferase [Methanosaeta sp. PtaB.Bin039]OPY44617.1 MAG: Orotate phosphoribosyltransferase [Methanosaeta sp. PtaU1.Bin028]HOT06394.1 orotate phosphoribosyltransferase [Methanotrichaceae archaeon]HQI90901.1 orotate phosphoribosyltransferase [Methanotrichaceae archaeon]HQJ28323.1 orotate phosphoribosyltransferase [Methanotrichaceae archaeon]
MSQNDRERLLHLLKTRALELRDVRLSSGRKSNYYVDSKRVILSSEGAYLAGKILLGMIRPEVGAVGGMTLGADPLVSSIAVLSHQQGREMSALIVRKEPKKHGTMSYIEGPVIAAGTKVAVVDDVVTSGGSLLRSVERIAEAGYQPVQVLAILDRQEGGQEAIAAAGYHLQSIFTRADLGLGV